MFEAIITGAMMSLIASLFVTPKKKRFLQIQMWILISIAVILFISFMASLGSMEEQSLAIFMVISTFVGEFFMIRKIYKNYKRLKNNDFEDNENK